MSLSHTPVIGLRSDVTTSDANSDKNRPQFPEENLLATEGFFIAYPGVLLNKDRYKVLRKLGREPRSTTFLVEDLQCLSNRSPKFLSAKILSVDSTNALKSGITCELDILEAVARKLPGVLEPVLPVLRDHFLEEGPHGVHFCFLADPLCSHVHAFRVSAPTGKLAVYIVKPIIAYVVKGLKELHSRNIIHAGIKADKIFFASPPSDEIERTIATDPPAIYGTFQLNGLLYPILHSQPFLPKTPWNATPTESELIVVALGDLGSAVWADQSKSFRDMSTPALRAPETIIRAKCGKEIDIWAIGCMTYELLTGQALFNPQTTHDLTADESLLLLQYSLTGETLCKEVIEQSDIKEIFRQKRHSSKIQVKQLSTPNSSAAFIRSPSRAEHKAD